MIYKLFNSWGPKCPYILYISVIVMAFCPHNVGFTRPHTHTHTHTHWRRPAHDLFWSSFERMWVLSLSALTEIKEKNKPLKRSTIQTSC